MTDLPNIADLPNIEEPVIEVVHANLTRFGEESEYKSKCPTCHRGILLMQRYVSVVGTPVTWLERFDRCITCAQTFWYTDESINGERFNPGAARYLADMSTKMAEPKTYWERLMEDDQ